MSANESTLWIIRLNRADGITLAALSFTGVAILLLLGDRSAAALASLYLACWCDALDGWYARRTQTQRTFGAHLDTNVDVLTHLFTPALYFYLNGLNHPFAIVILGLVIGSGVIRLAVFNETGTIIHAGHSAYQGLPVFWFPFLAGAHFLLTAQLPWAWVNGCFALLCTVFAALMLYRKPRFKPKSMIKIALTLSACIALVLTRDLWAVETLSNSFPPSTPNPAPLP
jgi:phosphatidylserine synthase